MCVCVVTSIALVLIVYRVKSFKIDAIETDRSLKTPFSKNDKSLLIKLMKHYYHNMYSTIAISLIQPSIPLSLK